MTSEEKRIKLREHCDKYAYCDAKDGCKIKKENKEHSCGRGFGYSEYNTVSSKELDKNYEIIFGTDNKQEKEKNMKFKVGDVVKIIGNKNSNHGFNIGEIVTIDMICCRGEKGENCRAHNKNKQSYYVSYTDIKLINTSSSQSFTITVSDTITTLKSADKTVEIKRYHEDKHDVKVAIDNVVKKYFDEVEREERIKNRPTKGEGLLGVKVPKGTKFKVINIESHNDKGRVCIYEYIGKIGTFNRDFTFDKGGFHSSGTFEEEYMDAIDKKNGKLCWSYDEVEILWED